jgi:hypothetical protein
LHGLTGGQQATMNRRELGLVALGAHGGHSPTYRKPGRSPRAAVVTLVLIAITTMLSFLPL